MCMWFIKKTCLLSFITHSQTAMMYWKGSVVIIVWMASRPSFMYVCPHVSEYKGIKCNKKPSLKGKNYRSKMTGWQMFVHGIRYIMGGKRVHRNVSLWDTQRKSERKSKRERTGERGLWLLFSTVYTQSAGIVCYSVAFNTVHRYVQQLLWTNVTYPWHGGIYRGVVWWQLPP